MRDVSHFSSHDAAPDRVISFAARGSPSKFCYQVSRCRLISVSPLPLSSHHSLDTPFFCALPSLFLLFCLLHFANNFHVDKMRRQRRKKKRKKRNEIKQGSKKKLGHTQPRRRLQENKVNNSIRNYNEMTLTASSFCFGLNNLILDVILCIIIIYFL